MRLARAANEIARERAIPAGRGRPRCERSGGVPLPASIWWLEVLTWNAGADRIDGYSAEEVVGRSIALLILPSARTSWAAYRHPLVAMGVGHGLTLGREP
jgi:hypothetical protein